jgi:calcineurin-like phosphoesterase family protein
MIWLTSDTHFGHKNVIGFCDRPFADLDEMHETLIKNFNKVVKPTDTIIFVGDITFLNTSKTKSIIDRINGTKIAVCGNHCPKPNSLLNMGFALAVYKMELEVRGQKVLISHYPFRPTLFRRAQIWVLSKLGRKTDLRYMDRRHKDDGKTYLIHGHTHSKRKFEGRALHVGVDAWNYQPVPLWQAELHIDKEKKK